MKTTNIIVIGAGPAGIMAAISAKRTNKNIDIIILEKNHEIAKKFKITGGGRCNLTSNLDISKFYDNIPTNSKFLYKAFSIFNNLDLISFFEKKNIKFSNEGNKVYPSSGRSDEIIDILKKEITLLGIKVVNNSSFIDIEILDNKFKVLTTSGIYISDKVIFATGGDSFKSTGSDGYAKKVLESKGVDIIPAKPSLVRIFSNNEWINNLEGISLDDVSVTIFYKNKKLKELIGDIVFAKNGISGPLILNSSSYISGLEFKDVDLYIDFLPELTNDDLIRIIKQNDKKNIINKFSPYLAKKFLKALLHNYLDIADFNNIKKDKINEIVYCIKKQKINFTGIGKLEESIVTKGGISVKDINPSTMELRKLPNIYVAGEIIDVDALTGGYNLQIAFSTGYLAGLSASNKE